MNYGKQEALVQHFNCSEILFIRQAVWWNEIPILTTLN